MSVFTGLPRATLAANLASLQTAYVLLASGGKVASASYTQGDGAKSTSFTQANLGQLAALIAMLQEDLGLIRRARRSIRFIHQ